MNRHARGWADERAARALAAFLSIAFSVVDGAKYGAGLFRMHGPKEKQ